MCSFPFPLYFLSFCVASFVKDVKNLLFSQEPDLPLGDQVFRIERANFQRRKSLRYPPPFVLFFGRPQVLFSSTLASNLNSGQSTMHLQVEAGPNRSSRSRLQSSLSNLLLFLLVLQSYCRFYTIRNHHFHINRRKDLFYSRRIIVAVTLNTYRNTSLFREKRHTLIQTSWHLALFSTCWGSLP